jgi:NAD(P)-dependent dehydrogenase (short-subunit alcohol dehydrogenase family)
MPSIAGFTGGVVGPHYTPSKAGLHDVVHFLAPRVVGQGVTVNAVAHALIEQTRMLPAAADGMRSLSRSVVTGNRRKSPIWPWRCYATAT